MDELQRASDLFYRALQLHRTGDLAGAEPLYREALLLAPQRVSVLVNLAAVLVAQRRFTEALALCERALKVEPDTPDALHTAALCRLELYGDDEGLALTERVLRKEPDNFAAHSNRGIALRDRGRFEEALQSFEQAVRLRPDLVAIRCNRAATLHALARPREALADYLSILRVMPAAAAAQRGLFEVLSDPAPVLDLVTSAMEPLLLRAVREPWGPPQQLAPLLSAVVARRAAVSQWLKQPEEPVAPLLQSLRSDQVLLALLECGVVRHPGLQRMFAALRLELLQRAAADDVPRKGGPELALHCALAQQAFLAGYLDTPDAATRDQLAQLRQRLQQEGSPAAPWIAACACFAPLYADPQLELLLARDWPEPVQRLLRQQLREPAEEQRLAAGISRLTPGMGEPETPSQSHVGPRWVALPPRAEPLGLSTHLVMRIPGTQVARLWRSERVSALVAGCGTGQRAVELAVAVRGIEVLAIDTDRCRLAYAKRMAQALLPGNLRFALADTLGIGGGLRFDLVECDGSRFPLQDAERGLALLASYLRPGGVMRLQLHSALGRRHLDAARDFVDARGFSADDAGIRALRHEILRQPVGSPLRGVLRYDGFHDIDGCRALLFEEREVRHHLPSVAALLQASGLNVLGIETTPAIRAAFRREFPEPSAATGLEAWHAFELRHPDSFVAGYALWVQRPEE